MINSSNLYRLYDLLGEMIFFGFANHFSSEYIEESVASSLMFEKYLDKGDDSFLNNLSQLEIFKGTYKNFEIIDEDLHKLNTISMWLGEAYLRLYFKYHKSISFIFMYFPLDKMSYMFDVYHEMDWTQLYKYFLEEVERKSVLTLLLKKRQLTAYELSVLSGIKYQTIKNYCRSNKSIYNASFTNISKISSIIKINSNVFMEEISNFIDASYLDLKTKNIEYLSNYAYHIISYFDKEVGEKDFKYDSKLEILKADETYLKILQLDTTENNEINNKIKEQEHNSKVKVSNLYLVFFVPVDLDELKILFNKFKKVFVLSPQSLVIVENGNISRVTISSLLHESAISLSKRNDAV